MVKVLVFDFDGVIIDSNKLKYDAFFQIFSSIPESSMIVKNILNRYREETRFFIIRRVLSELKRQKKINYAKIEPFIEVYAKKYNEIVEQGAIECKEIPCAKKVLEKLSKLYALYLNSTTPQESLIRIVEKRSLRKFFKGVYGAPKNKMENLAEILTNENVPGNEVVIIGDGESDLKTALKFGCHFIGIRNEFNRFNRVAFPVIEELKLLPRLLAEKNKSLKK